MTWGTVELTRAVSQRMLTDHVMRNWALAYETERVVIEGLAGTYCDPRDATLYEREDRTLHAWLFTLRAPDPIQTEGL